MRLLLLFLFIPYICYSQVRLNSSFEMGYEDRSISITNGKTGYMAWFKNNITSTFDLAVKYKRLKIYTDLKTYITSYTMLSYNPIQSQYRIGARYIFNRFELRYEHLCSHSIEQKYFYEGYDKFTLKVFIIK